MIPEIIPMRRGRPTKNEPDVRVSKPSPSPLRASNSDPFGALDAPTQSAGDMAAFEEISSRFPPLDQFSLLHDSGNKFAFDSQSKASPKLSQGISQRVTNALADEAFAQTAPSAKVFPARAQREEKTPSGTLEAKSLYAETKPTPKVEIKSAAPERPEMISTGTMTSPSLPEKSSQSSNNTLRPMFKFPPSPVNGLQSQPRASDASMIAATNIRANAAPQKRPGPLDHRSKSQIVTLGSSKSSASSRPSLEGQRPSKVDLEKGINRSKSANYRTRPASDHFGSNMGVRHSLHLSGRQSPSDDHLERSHAIERLPMAVTDNGDTEEALKIDSNVDFLRAMEQEDPSRRKHQRLSSGSKHVKRASMPSISLSSTKNLLAGRFGEAFRRFENTTSGTGPGSPSLSPTRGIGELTPIAGSEATDGRSDDGNVLEETEVPPEVRRELERRRLSQEEKRVADAAAAYRQRIAQGGIGRMGRPPGEANSRAASIQNKVKSLLDESGRASPSKSAEGYGRFTESPGPQQSGTSQTGSSPQVQTWQALGAMSSDRGSLQVASRPASTPKSPTAGDQTAQKPAQQLDRPSSRPSAPPKPSALRTGGKEEQRPSSPLKPPTLAGKALPRPPKSLTASEADEWEANFAKKYPSLAGLEMVETEIDKGAPASLRVRDV